MAINKNFVIKNGLEVNTNVLVAAADEKQVGIGTTRPYYKLHVGGGEGSRGGIGATDLTISGIATIGVGNSSQGALKVVGISTIDGDIDFLGSAGVSTVLWDASENRLEFKDNASIGFGTGNDLTLWHDGSVSYIKDTVGDFRIAGDKITLELEDGTNVKVIDQFGVNITGVTTTNRLLVSGISTFTGNVDANGGITANTVKVEDLTNNRVVIAGTGGEIEDDANFTYDGVGLIIGAGSGVTVSNTGNIAAAGIVTANGGIRVGTAITVDANTGNVAVSGILTVGGNLQVTGDITYDEISGRNLNITGITTFGGLVNVDAGITANTAIIEDLTNNRVVIAGSGGEIEDDANLTYDGIGLIIGAGSGVTVSNTGNIAAAGIATVGGTLNVTGATSLTSLDVSAGLGMAESLFHLGDTNTRIAFPAADTITADTAGVERVRIDDNGHIGIGINPSDIDSIGRSLNIASATGGAIYLQDTDDPTVKFAAISYNGVSAALQIHAHHVSSSIDFGTNGTQRLSIDPLGNVAIANSLAVTGIATADRFIGIHTSADGGGVGIASTTGHVGYGITYIDFKGPGVSTVYSSSVTGITTIYFQGGGGSSVGAAGTWQNDGAPGISTAKSVGINTNSINDGDLQGRPYVGAAGSFQGLYIGNGMVVNDNQLNGDHYIGTAFGGMMAGPVTVNGVLTVDGNYVVV